VAPNIERVRDISCPETTFTSGSGLPIIVTLRRESFGYQRALVMVGVVVEAIDCKVNIKIIKKIKQTDKKNFDIIIKLYIHYKTQSIILNIIILKIYH